MMKVLYEDDHILVVVKPAGTPSQPDTSGAVSLYALAIAHTGQDSLGLVQRLDRPVGGVMVLTKSPKAAKSLTEMVQNRAIDKYYLAVTAGAAGEEAHLTHWLQKVRGNRAVVSNKKTPSGKKAVLDYRCLKRWAVEGEPHNLLEVKLHTGRHHQIRAQLAHMKLPIIGDTKYNPAYQQKKGWHAIGLFAYKLAFDHPVTGERMVFEVWPEGAPFPEK